MQRFQIPNSPLLNLFYALLAGLLLPLAFAPINFWPMAIISPAVLLWLWQKASPRQAFYLGLTFGFGFFGVGVSWVFVSIHQFGNTDVPLAIFITFLFILALSLFLACQGYLLKRFFKGGNLSFCLLGFPAAWVLCEWVRSFLFSGFPWVYLGYAGLNTPLSGYAPWLSVYGVSFALLLSSGILIALFQQPKRTKVLLILGLLTLWAEGALLSLYEYTTPLGKQYKVSLVQGNISPSEKFSADNPTQAVKQTYGRLTNDHWNSDLILWPENAIPLPLPYSGDFVETLNQQAKSNNATLVTGIQTVVNDRDYYNSMVAVGQGSGIYHKRRLVPFGEYLPFDTYLRGLINFFDIPMSNFIEGPSNQPLLKMQNILLAPLICYEIAFPELTRSNTKQSNVIVTLSEDGWFGKSLGPHQHLQIAQMRALETGRYVLRATTSGITAIIKPDGKVETMAPVFESTVLKGNFEARQGETPWMIMGLWPLLIGLLLAFLLPGRMKLKK